MAHPRRELLRVARDRLHVIVDYEIAAGEAALGLRRAFDRDGDGRLDPGEQQALTEHLARTATLRTELVVDGSPAGLRRDAVRAEKTDLPVNSTALLAIRVDLSAPWPEKNKKNFFFDHFLNSGRDVRLSDEDPSGHVPITVECQDCDVTDASSGVADGNRVRGAVTPLRLKVKMR